MNTNFSLRIRILKSLIIILFIPIVCFSGDPVPGLDISLQQIPGGIVRTAKTGKDGKFIFDNLPPGKYLLNLVPLKTVENHNSSRSNKSYPKSPAAGKTECNVSITLSMTGPKKPFNPIEVIIGPNGGRIIGHVDFEDSVKKDELKK